MSIAIETKVLYDILKVETIMSHTMDPNIPNGIPSHLNGLESRSSHSSRDSSPALRMFPGGPGPGIPSSQLPPSAKMAPMHQLVNNYANMNIANTVATPQSSPALFSTSTPDVNVGDVQPRTQLTFNHSAALSPISAAAAGFTHSATSHFSNVKPDAQPSAQPSAPIPSQRPPMQPVQQQAQPQSNQQMQTPQVPSNGPLRNGGNIMQQNSLPSNVQPPPRPSLSQPRMMGYNYPGMPATTAPVPLTAPTSQTTTPQHQVSQVNGASSMNGHPTNSNMNQINSRMPMPPLQAQAPSNYPPAQQQYPSSANHLQHQPQSVRQPPMLQPQSSSPNLFNQRAGMPVMPPKSNSLSGPVPESYGNANVGNVANVANVANISTKAGLHANRYPQQLPPQPTQPVQSMQPNMQRQFNTNPIAPNYNYQQQAPNQQQQKYMPPQPQLQQIPLNPQLQYQQQQQPQQMYGHPQQHQQQQHQQQQQYQSQSAVQSGFNRLWGADSFDLLQTPAILPPTKVEAPRIALGNPALDEANCSPDIFRCTVTKIPESNALLQKSRLPLGILIHPFRDLNHLPVIQCNTIVRCRACRTYINPFVFFVDSKRWKCNLCYRVNELPEEFQYDPVTKTYGDPSRRPEVKASTIEYIAPAEYMLRPPQPAIYLFLLDISRAAVESGYLHTVCSTLHAELPSLPGDTRTHIGFIAYDSALHFYSLAEGLSQPHEMTVLDIDDIFLPCPDNLLVNLQERIELINDLLTQLPNRYNNSYDTGSALGAALQAAHRMMASTGGRITVFQCSLPTLGPGALTAREDANNRSSGEVLHLNPANDFYKRLALECSGQQVAVDLFIMNSQYVDVATISGITRFSGGCMYHFPLFKASRELQNGAFEKSLKRYLTRKIGFEAVMRIRCTRGLTIHTFHGNFFVRSTDLLSLPNVNPDAGYGMQVAIEENLSDVQNVCFQAALLYTSSKGERRIRVHTMCLPVVSTLPDVINSADQQCIVGLLAKMAVDRSMQSSLADAREAFINVAIDILSSYKLSQNMAGNTGLIVPRCLRLLPLYISALLKHPAFRSGISTRLDDRVKAMCDMKTRPLQYLIQQIYADLYPVHNLQDQITVLNDEEEQVHMPPILQLSARSIDSTGAYLFDMCDHMVLVVCAGVSTTFLNQALGVADYNSIADSICELPVLENEHNHRLHMFINYLNEEKPMCATLQIIRENSPLRGVFLERLVEDRIETALSYHEFLQHLKTQVK